MLSLTLQGRLGSLNRAGIYPQGRPATRQVSPCHDLQSLIPGEVVTSDHGSYYVLRQPIRELSCARPESSLAGDRQLGEDIHRDVQAFERAFPAKVLYLDLETCGFSGSALFLVGMVRHDGADLVVEQLLARNYVEERPVLQRFWELVDRADVIVSFNGKSFDWPFLIERSAVHRVPVPHERVEFVRTRPVRAPSRDLPLFQRPVRETAEPKEHRRCQVNGLHHLDILHLARRAWRKPLGLPDCRLQTLELHVCGRYRSGDIPGHAIAEAYHDFVRTGDARRLRLIVHHNALDLITLADLSLRLTRAWPNAAWSVSHSVPA